MSVANLETLKRDAARLALDAVEEGMRIGLGTGSTARHFVDLLGERVADGLRITGVPTSQATRRQAEALAIPLATLDEMPELDLAIDGADEIGPGLALIKGGGGAHWREKIVASAARRFIVIADDTKLVDRLGAFPLPIEVSSFGLEATRRAIARSVEALGLSGSVTMRVCAGGEPFVTDGGNFIVDARFGAIPDPAALALALDGVAGVIEHGLFLNLASRAIIASPSGARVIEV